MKSIKKLLIVMAIAMLTLSMAIATSSATNIANEKKDTGITIDSKTKTIKYTITWNANGGKIEKQSTVKTSVVKGKKIAKLPTTPKITGYTFKGWYTKKTGGAKITANTKPSQKTTYYAQWTKKSSSRVLTAAEKKIVGKYVDREGEERGKWKGDEFVFPEWKNSSGIVIAYQFKSDGTFISYDYYNQQCEITKGNWRIQSIFGTKQIMYNKMVKTTIKSDGTTTKRNLTGGNGWSGGTGFIALDEVGKSIW